VEGKSLPPEPPRVRSPLNLQLQQSHAEVREVTVAMERIRRELTAALAQPSPVRPPRLTFAPLSKCRAQPPPLR
jgi:hypothetical protein